MNPQLKRDLKLFDKERERLCDFVRKEIRLILERLAKRLNSNKRIEWHCGMGIESLDIIRDHDDYEIISINNGVYSQFFRENLPHERLYRSCPEIEEMYKLIEEFEEIMGRNTCDYGWIDLRGTKQ